MRLLLMAVSVFALTCPLADAQTPSAPPAVSSKDGTASKEARRAGKLVTRSPIDADKRAAAASAKENCAVEQAMQESAEKAERKVNQATTALATGIASGVLQAGAGQTQPAGQTGKPPATEGQAQEKPC